MNRTPNENDSFEREWVAQERATRDVRANVAHATSAPDASDPDAEAYRRVAQALRVPPQDHLPSNFAYQVAQLAARMPRPSRLDLRLEQWLVRGLVAAMIVGNVAVALIYGGDWLRVLNAQGAGTAGWLMALGACLGVSWGANVWYEKYGKGSG